MKLLLHFTTLSLLLNASSTNAFTCPRQTPTSIKSSSLQANNFAEEDPTNLERRQFFQNAASSAGFAFVAIASSSEKAMAAEESTGSGVQDSLNIDDFLRSGVDSGGPMGVSSQAGKSRPQTGVFLRDGTDVGRDKRTGSVSAEIVLGTKADPIPVLLNYNSPWPLATGSVYDIECRDSKTGDGAFVSVVTNTQQTKGKSISELSNDFFVTNLFSSTGRFSFYGAPTNIKVSKNTMGDNGDMRLLELSFSNLSQSTQTEIPRKAIVAATIPKGTDNVVMLVGSAAAGRWKKGSSETVAQTVKSFRVAPSPKSNLKVRVKKRGEDPIF